MLSSPRDVRRPAVTPAIHRAIRAAAPTSLAVACATSLATVAHAQCQIAVLDDAAPPTFTSAYGRAVALHGDRCVHGPGQGTPGPGSGRVVAHRWDGSDWVFEQTVFPAGLANHDEFGRAIAVDDDWLVVGAPGRDTSGPNAGAVWVYRREAGAWVEDDVLLPTSPQTDGAFGGAVAIDGDTIVVGERGGSVNGTGSVSIYTHVAGTWVLGQSLQPLGLSPSSDFGYALDCEDGLLAIGAELDATLAGEVRIFERPSPGSPFVPIQTVTPTGSYVGDIFGGAIDVDQGRVLVGAPASSPSFNELGAAHLFERAGTSFFVETGVFADPSVGLANWHGFDVALGDDVLAVGTPFGDAPELATSGPASTGTVSLWRLDGTTWRFDETFTREGAQANDRVGETVTIDDDWLAVGAPFVDTPWTNAGVTLLFSLGCDVDAVPPCGGNPPESLVHLAGRPAIGRAVTLGVTNTQFTQQPGALTLLMLSTAPAPGTCGVPLPGWSMYGPLLDGELRIDVFTPPNPFQILFGAPWAGFAQPSPFTIGIPNVSALVGDVVHVQGALIDPTSTIAPFAATSSMRLEIGPH